MKKSKRITALVTVIVIVFITTLQTFASQDYITTEKNEIYENNDGDKLIQDNNSDFAQENTNDIGIQDSENSSISDANNNKSSFSSNNILEENDLSESLEKDDSKTVNSEEAYPIELSDFNIQVKFDNQTSKGGIVSSIVNVTTIDNVNYMFLPSSANINAIPFVWNLQESEKIYINDIDITDLETLDVSSLAIQDSNSSQYKLHFTKKFVNDENQTKEFDLIVMKSSNLDAMFINIGSETYDRKWIDSNEENVAGYEQGDDKPVDMSMISNDSKLIYGEKTTKIDSMRSRGNSTSHFPKKPYQIKLNKRTDLLQTGKGENIQKTWVLLANIMDFTSEKTTFMLNLARYMGLKETPECKNIDLWIDGEYRGNYLLCEKVQIKEGRIDIVNHEDFNDIDEKNFVAKGINKYGIEYYYNPTVTSLIPSENGGFLCEVDDVYYKYEKYWFLDANNKHIVIKSPDNITKEQMEYISEKFFEMSVATKNGSFNGVPVEEIVDIDSFATNYLINIWSRNNDYSTSSTYFFLPEKQNMKFENKFYATATWDFDACLGIRLPLEQYAETTLNFLEYKSYWECDAIVNRIADKAKELQGLSKVLLQKEAYDENGLTSYSWYYEYLSSSNFMNSIIWAEQHGHPEFAKVFPNVKEAYEYTKNILEKRTNNVLPLLSEKVNTKKHSIKFDRISEALVKVYIDNPIVDGHTVVGVEFPTWSEINEQDDFQWQTGELESGKTYSSVINLDAYNNTGLFHTHAYATLENGEKVFLANISYSLDYENKNVINLKKIDPFNYKVSIQNPVINNEIIKSVEFPTWSAENNQDDLVWYQAIKRNNTFEATVNALSHKHFGDFISHVYGKKANGENVFLGKSLGYFFAKSGWFGSGNEIQYFLEGTPITGWLVTSDYKNYGLQRYYFGKDTYLVKSRVITESDGNGAYLSYARPEGFVVRGFYDTGFGKVYIADNNGRLPQETGWLITDKYAGDLQRYYIDSKTHAACSGFFEADGNKYFGKGGVGYVLRNEAINISNVTYYANNDGILLKR